MRLTASNIYVLDKDSHISAWAEDRGGLEDQNFAPYVAPYIKKGDVVVDAGAMIGDSTATFCRLVGPEGLVIAFEPSREAAACCEKNCPTADVRQQGLSNDFGWASLHEQANAGASYLGGDGSIQLVPLDSLKLERLNLLKIDVEGFEVRVLLGGRATIRRHRPVIVCEVNKGALLRAGFVPLDIFLLLDDLGYRYRNMHMGQPMEGDQYDIIAEPI